MLYRRTGDRDRAEDLAQETFARAVAAPPNNPRPWLFAVALNLVRKMAGEPCARVGGSSCSGPTPPRPDGPDEDFDRNERSAGVRAALATLTERDREALLLKAEGFNYGEIAATLGLSKGAVGTTLARARRRLVEAYRAEGRAKICRISRRHAAPLLDGELDLAEVQRDPEAPGSPCSLWLPSTGSKAGAG